MVGVYCTLLLSEKALVLVGERRLFTPIEGAPGTFKLCQVVDSGRKVDLFVIFSMKLQF